jgi:hypothetical protein
LYLATLALWTPSSVHSDFAEANFTDAEMVFEADFAEAELAETALAEAERVDTLRAALAEAEDLDNYDKCLEVAAGQHAADLAMDDNYFSRASTDSEPYAEPEPPRPFRLDYAAIPTKPTPATHWQEILRIVKVYYWLPIHNEWCAAWKDACGDAPYLYWSTSPSPARWNVSDNEDEWHHPASSSPESDT